MLHNDADKKLLLASGTMLVQGNSCSCAECCLRLREAE